MGNPSSVLTSEEAYAFLATAVVVLTQLEDLERPDSYAIPKAVLTCGEVTMLLGALVALIAEIYPETVSEVPHPVDLASRNFRREH